MAKVTITYVGPHDAVDVVCDGVVLGTCARDGSIEVDETYAKRLLEQDIWQASGGRARRGAKEGSE